MNLRLEPGHCWLSGLQCYEIKEFYNYGHPLEGHVRQVGGVQAWACKVTLLMMDGSTATVTVHESCTYRLPDCLNELWHSIIERASWEFENAVLLGVNYESVKDEERVIKQTIKSIVNNPPLGILAIEPWCTE